MKDKRLAPASGKGHISNAVRDALAGQGDEVRQRVLQIADEAGASPSVNSGVSQSTSWDAHLKVARASVIK